MRSIVIGFILIILTAGNLAAQDKTASADQAAMVATERAFAKLGFERGIRESFIQYFSPDCIVFGPHPTKLRGELEKQEPDKFPLPVTVNWTPVWGDISAAGDMGYNTGPVVYEDAGETRRPTRHVIFFSVWKKQPDGKWLVVLDVGSRVPSAVAPMNAPYQSATVLLPKSKKVDAPAELARMIAADRELLAATGNVSATWKAWLADSPRIHRQNALPVVGKDAVAAWLGAQNYGYKGENMYADIAASGDLGYTYGSAEIDGNKGYYARVWKRDGNGAWKVVVDIFSPLPPAKT